MSENQSGNNRKEPGTDAWKHSGISNRSALLKLQVEEINGTGGCPRRGRVSEVRWKVATGVRADDAGQTILRVFNRQFAG